MRNLRFVLAVVLLLPLAAARAEVPGADARRLARTVGAALAEVARAAGQPAGGVAGAAGKRAPAVAFRQALARWSTRVHDIESALDRRDGVFFLLVDQGSSDLGELRVAWARTGARNATISAGLGTASAAYRTLRSEYGREGVRQRQGGPLSAAEKAQLQRLQRAERRFAANLQGLCDQARRHGDKVSAAELERFRAEAARIGQASLDLASYLNALIATSELRGEWSADAVHVRKSVPAQPMAAAEETVQDLYVDSDIGQVFTVDLGPAAPAAPAPPAQAAASPAPGAEPVQAFQAVPGDMLEEETGEAVEAVEAVERVPTPEPAAMQEAGSATAPESAEAPEAPEEEEQEEMEPPPAADPAATPVPLEAAAPPPPAPPAPPAEGAAEAPIPPPIG
jgi:hypothetical protein